MYTGGLKAYGRMQYKCCLYIPDKPFKFLSAKQFIMSIH